MTEFAATPIWDELLAERDGRAPAEFVGHETWHDSDEAREAEARGRAEAEATAEAFLGWNPAEPREWPPPQFPEDDDLDLTTHAERREDVDDLDAKTVAERIETGDDEL